MKRLVNKYSAFELHEGHGKQIDDIMVKTVDHIWKDIIILNDLCPRDAVSLCHDTLSVIFAQHILRHTLSKKVKNQKQ